MGIVEALVLGIVQGLTEFVPVSSSGHLIAAHEFFGTTESTLVFDVSLHIGTLIALIIFFWRDIIKLLTHAFAKNEEGKLARIIFWSTFPAAIIGYIGSDWIDAQLRKPAVVVGTMILMGALMLFAEKWSQKHESKNKKAVTMSDGITIGFAQALALIPGVSRSGATITMGLFRGLKRADAARFSFLLAIPITCGAIAGSLLGADPGELHGQASVFIIGILAAACSGLLAIKYLLRYLSKNSLAIFAYYRFAVALIVFMMIV
ncbi:MAG TPA: undecaprenyl-diphosphatase UppP [Candidatus Saccharibacteria bacterium]|nr:undecaprenyl-diphosphatase UppP [Candidatus Saccharibacteria bacterium]